MKKPIKQSLSECSSRLEMTQLLKTFDLYHLKSNEIDQINRAMNQFRADADLKVAFIGNYTLELFPRYSSVAALRSDLVIDCYVGPYNQYFQEILDTNSGLQFFRPNVLFLFLSMRQLSPNIYYSFLSLSENDKKHEAKNIIEHIDECLLAAKKNTDATIFLSNFSLPPILSAETADMALDSSEIEFYLAINRELGKEYKDDPRIIVLDLHHVINQFGIQPAHNNKMYYLAKMEWSEACMSYIANHIVKYLLAALGRAKKCLVVDLDNTLWGGILGEDGKKGIKIGPGEPQGEAFYDFQRYIISLKQRGVILAICSKNNEADVLDVFKSREMPLSLDDFSAYIINWQPKFEGIQQIAKKLNIGLNSLVFIDDSEMECALVKDALPEVEVVRLPKDPSEYIVSLSKLNYFDKLHITEEDRRKTNLYKENSKREEYREDVGDLDTYLKKLETKIRIKSVAESELARIHQLFTKTNQFNLTTKRYSLSELQGFIESDKYIFAYVNVEDRFGSLGIVGTYLIEKLYDIARIDSFILSCRAMGRKVETAVMNYIKATIFNLDSISEINASYIPSEKNIPAENFYEDQGYEIIKSLSNGEKNYSLKKDMHRMIENPVVLLEH